MTLPSVSGITEKSLTDFPRVRALWEHQEQALARAYPKDYFALFFETGTGKTLTALTIARSWMYRGGRTMRTLVLSPPITLQNWRNEWLAGSNFSAFNVAVAHGHGDKRCNVFEDKSNAVVITNYESLISPKVFKAIEKWKPDVIIFDESHRVKSHSAKRTKQAFQLAQNAKHRLILTGTPILNSPMDIFSQWKILDLGEDFGKNFFQFRGEYFYDKNARMPSHIHFPKWEIREDSLDIIKDKIAQNSMFVAKSACLDLPPLVKTVVKVPLSSEQRKVYNDMAKDLIAYVASGVSVARLALTKAMRLQQIVSGFINVEDANGETKNHEIEDNPRLGALTELLSDRAEGSKCIVWASFRHNYRQIAAVCEKLNLPYVEIHGDKTQKEKDTAVKEFNENDSVRVCIGHPGSGGIGVNLTSSNVTIFYSRSFSLEHDIQAEARNYRGGSEIHEKVTRIDLVAEDTIDEYIAAKLEGKQAISDSVLHELVNLLEREQ